MSVRRKKEGPGPVTAAGLVSFYRDVEPLIQLKPLLVFLITASFTAAVAVARIFLTPS
ncbi:MAG: preprotein translocase subunit Sec61beta [Sulfolobales archaeon]